MSIFENLEPKDALHYFAIICSIPHPSGHEQALAEKIADLAKEKGLSVKTDHAGNVRIDRPPADGMENAPHIILQGHLDMVPAAIPGKDFDFRKQPIEPVVRDGKIFANGTTLGADNGAGAAAALAMLFNPELKVGKLSGLFTVGEETGLVGANALESEMLDGDWLFNLDSGEFHKFCIGCAGGARLSMEFPLKRCHAPAGNPFTVRLSGLAGGHSGMNIHENRGNALILLLQFLQNLSVSGIISVNGGAADNVIPGSAEAEIVTEQEIGQIQASAAEFIRESSLHFSAPEEYRVEVYSGTKSKIWDPDFMKKFLRNAATVPNGVFSMDETLGIVKTSSNFASIETLEDRLIIKTSQRSLEDPSRIEATEMIQQHFSGLNGIFSVSGIYPGWPADPDSEPVRLAGESYKELYGKHPEIYAIHAGLETGAFCKKNPSLKILSIGPEEENIHTPKESLDIKKYEEFIHLLRYILNRTVKGKEYK